MKLLAHRGYWKTIEEKNSLESLVLALKSGYGIETDIRDYEGKLVISHNIAEASAVLLETFLEEYYELRSDLCLALNVKADGIQELLISLLQKYGVENYFMFDMSVPELIVYDKMDMKFFTRQSDVETECVMYEKCQGVWMDAFYDDSWLVCEKIEEHLENGKIVCIVSPELHGKAYEKMWEMLLKIKDNENLILCTDVPDEARRFFGIYE